MGLSSRPGSSMLHLLLASSLLALSSAEADPQLLLNGALPYAAPVLAPVGAVAHAPVVKSVVGTPAEVKHEITAHAVAVGYHGLPAFGYYGKRSADAAVLAGASRVLTPPTPLIAGLPHAGLPYYGASQLPVAHEVTAHTVPVAVGYGYPHYG